MKKFFAILCCIIIGLMTFAFVGCGDKFKNVSKEDAIETVSTFTPLNIEKGGIYINIDANVYGMKSKTFYNILVKEGDVQMYGESDPMDIETKFYYTGGYVYGKSNIDGEIVKLKQKISLPEFIFGSQSGSIVDNRISLKLVCDPIYTVSKFAEDFDSKFYTYSNKEKTGIKVVLSTHNYYPQTDHTIDSTQTVIFTYDKSGNFNSMQVELVDVRVSRGYKEKSKIVLKIGLFDGDIELPSVEELAQYREQPQET